MIHPVKMQAALDAKRDLFKNIDSELQKDFQSLNNAIDEYENLKVEEILDKISEVKQPGSYPTQEHSIASDMVISFKEEWNNHQESRGWAKEKIKGVITFAADGSQIMPSKDISVPVGVVQVGWFENNHQDDGGYIKDIAVDVLSPKEFAGDALSSFPDQEINWKRFELEIETLIQFMERNVDSKPTPICFFDGSLILSFVQHVHPNRQADYVNIINKLIDTSERTRVLLVGYVDTSYATDIVSLLSHVTNLTLSGRISDAGMLRIKMKWGDRTPVFICGRDDSVQNKYYHRVCFSYLRTTGTNPPARIDFPRWIFEEDQHERMIDLIRAEVVIGAGYPYALETADALAVLSFNDRDHFYKIFQEFAKKEGFSLRFGTKSTSKRKRRI
ncbi:MAG: DNA double-strand break repair nuclease NurA [Candidatus Brocadiales bacterium]|nr:DNA double-strand break repair nuclease NurA [Candidatus Brocadiales bacterium]